MSLITLNEYKLAVGIPVTDTSKDAQVQQALDWATDVIRLYTGRDFDADPVTETRTFAYDGSGFLDIDDASAVTAVSVNNRTVSPQYYVLGPDNGGHDGIYAWIENLPHYEQFHSAFEMGFTRNEDRTGLGGGRPLRASVTGTFGFPDVPPAIKQAVVWITAAYVQQPGPFISESIEGYSRTTALPGSANTALPARAQEVLDLYVSPNL